eukprot:985388-Rhodomonas_salina.1
MFELLSVSTSNINPRFCRLLLRAAAGANRGARFTETRVASASAVILTCQVPAGTTLAGSARGCTKA